MRLYSAARVPLVFRAQLKPNVPSMPASSLDSRLATRRSVPCWLLIALLASVCCVGCVRRRMTIRTNPPGAQVYVDDYELGPTPISADFTYYGNRKIRLVKDGYETETFLQSVPAPWYQIPPLDFFAENLVPGEIRDQRTFNYQLSPQRMVPSEELLQRGEDLRRGVRPAGVRPARAVAPDAGASIAPMGPGAEPIPPGVGGYPIHTLPPSGR